MITLLDNSCELTAKARGYDTSLYWIRTKRMSNISTQGYVGITSDVCRRFNEHNRNNEDYYQKKPKDMLKYFNRNGLFMEIIYRGSRDSCLKLEKSLRPAPSIGWNSATGGGDCPLRNTGKLYYSKKLKTEKTIRGWADYSGKTFEEIRMIIRRGYSDTIDHALGLIRVKKPWKYDRKTDSTISDEVVFMLENTAKTPTRIFKELGHPVRTYKEMTPSTYLPRYLWDNAILWVMEGRYSVILKRQRIVTDLDVLAELYDELELQGSISKTYYHESLEITYEQMNRVVECLEKSTYFKAGY